MKLKLFDIIGIIAIIIFAVTCLSIGLSEKHIYALISFIVTFFCLRGILIESTGFTLWLSPQIMYFVFAIVVNFIGVFDFWNRIDYSNRAPEIVKTIVLLYNIHFILIYFGTFVYNRIKRIEINKLITKYYAAPFENIQVYFKLVAPSIFVFVIASLIVWFVSFKGQYYPLVNIRSLLSGNVQQIHDFALQVRSEISFGGLSGGAYAGQAYFNQLRIMMIPVIVMFWVVLAFLTKDRRLILLSIVGFIVTSVLLTGFFERGVLLIFFIRIFILIPLLVQPKIVDRRKFLISSIIVLGSVLILLTLLSIILGRLVFTSNILSDFSGQIIATLKRFYSVNSLATFYGFKVVPELLPFQNGYTWTGSIEDYLPGRDLGWSAIIYKYGPWGVRGNATQSLFCELWANGGTAVVVFGSFIIGFCLQAFNVWMANQQTRDVIRLLFFNVALFSVSATAMSNLFTGVDTGLLAAIVMLWLMQVIRKIVFFSSSKLNTVSNIAS